MWNDLQTTRKLASVYVYKTCGHFHIVLLGRDISLLLSKFELAVRLLMGNPFLEAQFGTLSHHEETHSSQCLLTRDSGFRVLTRRAKVMNKHFV